jgi:hypothetical protein
MLSKIKHTTGMHPTPHVSYAEMKRSFVPAPGVAARKIACHQPCLSFLDLGVLDAFAKTLNMVEASSVR